MKLGLEGSLKSPKLISYTIFCKGHIFRWVYVVWKKRKTAELIFLKNIPLAGTNILKVQIIDCYVVKSLEQSSPSEANICTASVNISRLLKAQRVTTFFTRACCCVPFIYS